MAGKLAFYEEHGVEEYYVYDPDADLLTVYTRGPLGAAFVSRPPATFATLRMGIRFDLSGDEMVVYGPAGNPFLTFEALTDANEQLAALAQREAARAEQDAARGAHEEARANDAILRAREAQARAEAEAARAAASAQLIERIKVLSRKRRAGTATPEDLAELDGLTDGPS